MQPDSTWCTQSLDSTMHTMTRQHTINRLNCPPGQCPKFAQHRLPHSYLALQELRDLKPCVSRERKASAQLGQLGVATLGQQRRATDLLSNGSRTLLSRCWRVLWPLGRCPDQDGLELEPTNLNTDAMTDER